MTSPLPNPEFREYRQVQRQYDAETRRVMEAAAKRIRARIRRLSGGIGAQVRAAQLRLVLAEIDGILHAAWVGGIMPTIQAGRKAGAEAAQAALETLTAPLFSALPPDVAQAVTDGLRLTARSGIESDFKRVPRELSARVYKHSALTRGRVNQKIREGLISGLTAKELAKDVYNDISPNTPGGASYAAMRLARTEINNAFHERQLEGSKRPGVSGVKWNLSGSHRVPDECNLYAQTDKHDKGVGVFPVGQVPDKPHPQCFCYMTYVTIKPKEFATALAAGSFDDELDRRTKANLARLGVRAETVIEPHNRVTKREVVQLQPTTRNALRKLYGEQLKISKKMGSESVAHQHLGDLLSIPENYHVRVREGMKQSRNGGVFIVNGPMTEASPQMAKLKGVTPRGWPPGRTWDEVPGGYSKLHRQLLLGNGTTHAHGSSNLANHEFGHALNDVLSQEEKSAFHLIWNKLTGITLDPYFMKRGNPDGYESEGFAETFASWSAGKGADYMAESIGIRRNNVMRSRVIPVMEELSEYFTELGIGA